jgi:hypothetical protein
MAMPEALLSRTFIEGFSDADGRLCGPKQFSKRIAAKKIKPADSSTLGLDHPGNPQP